MKTISKTFVVTVGVAVALSLFLWVYVQWENHRVTEFAGRNLDNTYHKHVRIVNLTLSNAKQYIWWIVLPFGERTWNIDFVNPNYNNKQSATVTRNTEGRFVFSFPPVIGWQNASQLNLGHKSTK